MPNSFETQINKGFSLIEGNLHSCSETMWRNHVIWHQSQRWNENCLCCIFGGKWIYLCKCQKFCCHWTVLHWWRASFLQPCKWLCLLSFLSTLQKNNWHGHQQLWRIVNVSLFWTSLQQAWKKLEQTPKTFMRPKWNATKKVDKTPNLVSRSQALYSVWSRQPFCST